MAQSFVDLPVTFTLLHIFYLLAVSENKEEFIKSLNTTMDDFFKRSCITLQFNFGENINNILRLFGMHSTVGINAFETIITCGVEHKAMIKREIELFKESVKGDLMSSIFPNGDSHSAVNQSLFTKVKFITEQQNNEQLSFIIHSQTDFNNDHKIFVTHKAIKGSFLVNESQYYASYPELNSGLITENDDKSLNKKLILLYKQTQKSEINVHFQDKVSSYYYTLCIGKIEDKSSAILPQKVVIERNIGHMEYAFSTTLKNTKTATLTDHDIFDNKQFPIKQDCKSHIVIPCAFSFAAPTTLKISTITIKSTDTNKKKEVHNSSSEFKMESLTGKDVNFIKKIQNKILYNNTDSQKSIKEITSNSIRELDILTDDCFYVNTEQAKLHRTPSKISLFSNDNMSATSTLRRRFSRTSKKYTKEFDQYCNTYDITIKKKTDDNTIAEEESSLKSLDVYSNIDECRSDSSQKNIPNEQDNFESASDSSDKNLPQTIIKEVMINNHESHESQSNTLTSATSKQF